MSAVGELVISQWYVFLAALLVGVGLSFGYDLFRVVRRVIPHNIQAITVEDFLYWVCWTLTVMTMLDALDKGAIRGFSLGAVFLGMIFYFLCFSRIVLKVLVFLLGWVKKILGGILGILLWPWKKLWMLFRPVVRYNKEKISTAGRRMKEKHTDRKRAAKQRREQQKEQRKAQTGELHGKKNARHRKQKEEKEKSHRKDRNS